MADIQIKRTHALGLAAARSAADQMAQKLGKQFGLSGDWEGNTLHFNRPGVNGTLAVTAKELKLEVTLGFLLKAMKGPIENAVHNQLDQALEATATAKASPVASAKKKR